MNIHEIDFNGNDLAEDLIKIIEKDYGRTVYRIPKFARTHLHGFKMTCIFTDYTLLEADIIISPVNDIPTIEIHGKYF